MVKRFCIILVLLILTGQSVFAQDEEENASDSAKKDSTIDIIREKIEKQVSDNMNKTSKQVMTGFYVNVKDDIIELKSSTDEDKLFNVIVDESYTNFFEASVDGLDEITIDDLEKNDFLIVSGPAVADQVSAKVIYRQVRYVTGQGQIVNLDKDSYAIDIVTSEKDEYTLDIEDDTVQGMLNIKTLEIEKAGFSKFKIGDNIHFVIEKPQEKETKATAVRTLIIPQEFFTDGSKESP